MVVLVTVLIPMLVSSILDLSMGWVWLMLAGWCLASVLIMGSMAQEQRADVDQRISEKIDEVSGQVSSLEHKHDESAATIAGLQQQVDEVDQVMRNAFEELRADLPARRYYVQASVSWSIMTGEATVEVRGGSRRARIWRWFKSKAQWVWCKVWG